MIKISEEAKNLITSALEKNPGKVARLALKKGGCAGTMLSLELTDSISDDKVVEVEGISVSVDSNAVDYIEDISIELKSMLGSDIIVRNLKAATCRCGKSFRV